METICDELKQTMDVKDEQIIYIDLDSRKNRNIKTADALEALIDSQTTSQEKIYLFMALHQ